MQVVLMEDVPKLGSIGDLVTVKAGYARNFLLPKNMAIPASTSNVKRLEHEKRLANFRLVKAREGADVLASKLGGLSLTFERKVGDQDKLFGSVTTLDIERALAEQGFELDRRCIQLEEPLKELGEFEVAVRVHKDVSAKLKVAVVAG